MKASICGIPKQPGVTLREPPLEPLRGRHTAHAAAPRECRREVDGKQHRLDVRPRRGAAVLHLPNSKTEDMTTKLNKKM